MNSYKLIKSRFFFFFLFLIFLFLLLSMVSLPQIRNPRLIWKQKQFISSIHRFPRSRNSHSQPQLIHSLPYLLSSPLHGQSRFFHLSCWYSTFLSFTRACFNSPILLLKYSYIHFQVFCRIPTSILFINVLFINNWGHI